MDTLPDGQLETAGCVLPGLLALSLSNPAMATPAKAPMDDEPITAREAKAMIWKAPVRAEGRESSRAGYSSASGGRRIPRSRVQQHDKPHGCGHDASPPENPKPACSGTPAASRADSA